MVRYSLAVPLRGDERFREMLVPPLLRLAKGGMPVFDSSHRMETLCTLVFMLESDERVLANQLVWGNPACGVCGGYLPEATANQLWAMLVSWSFHTSVGFVRARVYRNTRENSSSSSSHRPCRAHPHLQQAQHDPTLRSHPPPHPSLVRPSPLRVYGAGGRSHR